MANLETILSEHSKINKQLIGQNKESLCHNITWFYLMLKITKVPGWLSQWSVTLDFSLVMVLGSWDQVLCLALGWARSLLGILLLLPLPLPPSFFFSLSQKKKKKKKSCQYLLCILIYNICVQYMDNNLFKHLWCFIHID